jgi:hypothetical protein
MKGVCLNKFFLFIIFDLVYVAGFDGTVKGFGF